MDLSPLSKLNPWGAATLDNLDTENVQDGQRIGGKSNRQYVRFYNRKVMEVHATEVARNERTGEVRVLKTTPVEVEREFVQIVTPGDKNEVDQPAEDFHKREFFRQYAQFRDGKTAPMGTPIEDCSYVGPSVATELVYRGCKTEEQLADASEVLCGTIADGFSLREFARASVRAKNQNANMGQITAMRSELQKAMDRIAELEAASKGVKPVEAGTLLTAEGDVLTPKRGPGRPRKEEQIEAA